MGSASWYDHHQLRMYVKRVYKPQEYKSMYHRIKHFLYGRDNLIRTLMQDGVYILEVIVDGHRGHHLPANLSIGVYDAGVPIVGPGCYKERGAWRDGCFYFMLNHGKLSRIAFDQPTQILKDFKPIMVHRPKLRLS